MNFIKHQLGGLIVHGDIVTIFKKFDLIQSSPLVREVVCEENEEYNELQIELNQLEPLKKKLEHIIEDLKQDGTIGENPIKNINRTKEKCALEII